MTSGKKQYLLNIIYCDVRENFDLQKVSVLELYRKEENIPEIISLGYDSLAT